MKRKALVMISSFFICFFSVSSVYVKADSASLVVKLGSLASGGLSDSAFLGTFGPVAGVLAAYALQANGINTHISEASAEQGITKTEYIFQTLSNWCDVTNRDALDVVQSIVNNVSYGSGGTLYFAKDALSIIEQVGNWIISNSEIYSPSLPVVEVSKFLDVGDYNFPVISNGSISFTNNTTSSNGKILYINISNLSSDNIFGFCGFNDSMHQVVFTLISPYSFSGRYYFSGTINGTAANFSGTKRGQFYSYSIFTNIGGSHNNPVFSGLSNLNLPVITPSAYRDHNGFVQNLSSVFSIVENSPDIPDQFYGDTWADNVSGLSLPEGYTGAIDTGVIQGLQEQIQGVGDYVIGLQEYIHALEDAINGREADVPVEDADTSLPFPVPVPQEVSPTYEPVAPESYPAEDEVEDIVNPQITAPSTDIINGLQFDLTQVFPFCIPFDIYALLQKFVAEPIAPQLHIDWEIPFVDSNFVLDIDFSVYNSVAAVLRTMELIGAIVGLAIATRAIYLRS